MAHSWCAIDVKTRSVFASFFEKEGGAQRTTVRGALRVEAVDTGAVMAELESGTRVGWQGQLRLGQRQWTQER